jgi:hypothetical protein
MSKNVTAISGAHLLVTRSFHPNIAVGSRVGITVEGPYLRFSDATAKHKWLAKFVSYTITPQLTKGVIFEITGWGFDRDNYFCEYHIQLAVQS